MSPAFVAPGVCRHCGCREDNPCTLPDGDTCVWVVRNRTVCNRSSCQIAEKARLIAIDRRIEQNQRDARHQRRERAQQRRKGRAA